MPSGFLFGDILSVRSFGAVGDGVADDTSAFVAAIRMARSKRKALFVPSGIYLVQPLTILLQAANV